MGDIGTLLDLTLLIIAILVAGAMSGYLSERAGIVNLGIDGMMCMGALFFGIFSSSALKIYTLGFGGIFIALLLTMICTISVGALHAFACIKLKADHTISGTAINLLGLAFASFLNQPLAEGLFPGESLSKIQCNFNPILPLGNGSLFGSSIILLAVVLAITLLIWLFVEKTKTGLRYKAVGENPNAVDAQGISVYKYQWVAVIAAGAAAGLAGGLFLFRTQQFNGDVQSMGYLAIAILITGGWKIIGIIVFAMIFAVFTASSNTTTLTQIGISQLVVFAIPYIITLAILMFNSKKLLAPAHDGLQFEKGLR